MSKKHLSILFFVCKLNACTFNFDLTSQRTALENQIMGTYRELDDELILMSTVRGAGETSKSISPKESADILLRRRNQQFNRDDIEELKDRGIIGETHRGLAALLPPIHSHISSPKERDLAAKLIAEENKDRRAIWAYIIAKSRGLHSEDLPRVAKSYGEMQRKQLPKGQWYQDHAGIWQKK